MGLPLEGSGSEFSRSPEDYVPKQERYGIRRGIVEDVNDPEHRGRIRVRVDSVHDKDQNLVPTETLEWAEPIYQDGGGNNYGDFNVPYNIGDKVLIVYLQGRPDQPFWMCGWYPMDKERNYAFPQTPEEAWRYHDSNDQPLGPDDAPEVKPPGVYPKRRVIKTRHGHVIEISDEPGDFEIILRTPIGQRLWLRESLSTEGKKQYVKGIRIEDDKHNYIHMNTEDGLLDIYWDGNKRERITGNVNTTIGGNEVRDVALDQSLNVDGSRTFNVGVDDTGTVGGTREVSAGGLHRDNGNPIDHN